MQGSSSYVPGKIVMPVLNFLLCIDKTFVLLDITMELLSQKPTIYLIWKEDRRGRWWGQRLQLFILIIVLAFSGLKSSWNCGLVYPALRGCFLDCKVLFVGEGTVLSVSGIDSTGLELCWGWCLSWSEPEQIAPSTAAFSPSSSVSAVAPVQLLLVLLEIRSAKDSFHFL